MPGPAGHVTMAARLAAALRAIPAGRVAGHADLARQLGCTPPLIVQLLARSSDADRRTLPWHRVVADGGAVGRHARREEQIALLRGEGVVVSPAGIVHDFASRRVGTFDVPIKDADQRAPVERAAQARPSTAPARARGLHARPSSTIPRK